MKGIGLRGATDRPGGPCPHAFRGATIFLGGPRAAQKPTAPSPGTVRTLVRSSGPRGWPGAEGAEGAARSPRTVVVLIPGSGRCSLCWRGGFRCRMQLPGVAGGSAAVSSECARAAR